jgi:hypothetical protein
MIKQYIKDFKELDFLQKTIYFTILGMLLIFSLLYPIILVILGIGLLLFGIYAFIKNKKFESQAVGNGIIFGGRGKGKGLLLNKRINTDRNNKHFCNIPYNKKTELIDIKEYIDSIIPNTTENFINNNIQVVKKVNKFEKVNVYWDDVGVYAPNFMDNQLKKFYPSLSALLPINRHLYDAHMIIITQDINRPYKLLRELQTDFAIKAISSHGFGWLWNAIPLIRFFSTTKYIYYENNNSAVNGLLPFHAKGVVNDTIKHGLLTAGQATKEVYEAQHGNIRYGRIFQLKKNINYDTRYFHQVVFNEKAPKN